MNNTELKPEILKKIAEMLGYKAVLGKCYSTMECCPDKNGNTVIFPKYEDSETYIPFDPYTNNDQLIECENYLFDKGFSLEKVFEDFVWSLDIINYDHLEYEGKTRAEAAMNTISEL